MSMLGFVYLILILGWILIVLFLKCKRSITPHMGFSDSSYADAIAGGLFTFLKTFVNVTTGILFPF